MLKIQWLEYRILRYIDPMKMKFVRQQKKEDPRTKIQVGAKDGAERCQ